MKGVTGTHLPFTLAHKTCLEGLKIQVFTRLYIRIFLPEKAFTRSHSVRFLLISNCFKCEGLVFKAFTPLSCEGSAVKGWETKYSHAYICGIFCPKKHSPVHKAVVSYWVPTVSSVKGWDFKHSHGSTVTSLLWMVEESNLHTENFWKSEGKSLRVKGWILFWG